MNLNKDERVALWNKLDGKERKFVARGLFLITALNKHRDFTEIFLAKLNEDTKMRAIWSAIDQNCIDLDDNGHLKLVSDIIFD